MQKGSPYIYIYKEQVQSIGEYHHNNFNGFLPLCSQEQRNWDEVISGHNDRNGLSNFKYSVSLDVGLKTIMQKESDLETDLKNFMKNVTHQFFLAIHSVMNRMMAARG